MTIANLISEYDLCIHHNIEVSFIQSIQEIGLIEITTVEQTRYIHESQLYELERMIRLYHDLDINLEGIESINYLLLQIDEMKDEISMLKNKLSFYEQMAG